MIPWKLPLLWLYTHGTHPVRRRSIHRLEREQRAPVVVITHHRISDRDPNAWSCSNRSFIEQVRWLADHGDIVTMAEAQRRIREGNPRIAFCITFDDGYAENLDQAFPFLLKERLPFTCFPTTGQMLTGEPFEHDVAIGCRHPPLTLPDVKDLASAGVEIGAHTRTHADAATIKDPEMLRDEIVTAGRDLAEAVGCRVRYFAFAYGWHANLTREAFRLAREAGYEAACSCYGGYNFPGDDAFHVQRFGGPDRLLRLINIATIDPRKLAIPRYEY